MRKRSSEIRRPDRTNQNFKPKNTWEVLFAPPCPKCQSTEVVVTGQGRRLLVSGKDFFDNILNEKEGMAAKDPKNRSYSCKKCGTQWTDDGDAIFVS